jgi:hypothetical protein
MVLLRRQRSGGWWFEASPGEMVLRVPYLENTQYNKELVELLKV